MANPLVLIKRPHQTDDEIMASMEAAGGLDPADRHRVRIVMVETWRDRRCALVPGAEQNPNGDAMSGSRNN